MDLSCGLCFRKYKYMTLCAKMIYSWIRNVLGITKAHISPGTHHVGVVSAALVSGVSLLSILQTGDWATVSTQPELIFLFMTLILIAPGFHSVSCPWSQ